MPVYYLETSVLVKYYVTEPGSAWTRQLVDDKSNVLFTSEITITEVSAALAVVARVGRVSRRMCDELWGKFKQDLLTHYDLLPTHRTIINRAADLCQRYPLRGFDAVQLASGLQLQTSLAESEEAISLTFVSGDDRVVDVAGAEGLVVDNPFWHTDLGA